MKEIILFVFFLVYIANSWGQNHLNRFGNDSLLKISVEMNILESYSLGGGPFIKNDKDEINTVQDRRYATISIVLKNIDTVDKYITITSLDAITFNKKKENYWEQCRPDLIKSRIYAYFSQSYTDYEDYIIMKNIYEANYRFIYPEARNVKRIKPNEVFNIYLNIPSEIIDLEKYKYLQLMLGELTLKKEICIDENEFYPSSFIFIQLLTDERTFQKRKNTHKHLHEAVNIVNINSKEEDYESLEIESIKQIKTPIFSLF